MQMLNKLWNPVVMLATGFVLGLGATNYFAASGHEGKETVTVTTTQAAAPPLPETNMIASSTTLGAPIQQVTGVESATQDRVAVDMPGEDVSLSETVDVSRQETATTEPSPEELAYSHIDQVTTPRFSAQEIDIEESQLRLKSENTVATPLAGNEGLLPHEIL